MRNTPTAEESPAPGRGRGACPGRDGRAAVRGGRVAVLIGDLLRWGGLVGTLGARRGGSRRRNRWGRRRRVGGGGQCAATDWTAAGCVGRGRSSAVRRTVSVAASAPTKPSSAEPRALCHGRPRKYSPGTSVTPAVWRVTPPASITPGTCSQE